MSLILFFSQPDYLSASLYGRGVVCIGPDVASPNYPQDGRSRGALGPDVDIKLWGKGRWTGKRAMRQAGYTLDPDDMKVIQQHVRCRKTHKAYLRQKRRAEVHAKRAERKLTPRHTVNQREYHKQRKVHQFFYPTFPKGADVAICPGL